MRIGGAAKPKLKERAQLESRAISKRWDSSLRLMVTRIGCEMGSIGFDDGVVSPENFYRYRKFLLVEDSLQQRSQKSDVTWEEEEKGGSLIRK